MSQLPAFEVETSEILSGLSRTWLKKLFVQLKIYLENYISTFYGNYFDSPKDFNVSMFDDLDLGEFFLSTRPEVVILRCQVNSRNSSNILSNLDQYAKMPPTDTSFDAIWMVFVLQIQWNRNVTQDQNESDIVIFWYKC